MSGIYVLQLVFFILGSVSLIYVSRPSMLHPRSHGFYRFFAWEILLGMFLLNVRGWFNDAWAWYQLISWGFLVASIVFVVLGLRLLRTIGQQDGQRKDPALLGLERTSRLVTSSLYRYIRHPLYSSLLFLAWGMFFKSPSWLDGGLALLCTLFLTATARVEEQENMRFFGDEYAAFMKHSKMFIPFIF